MLRFIKKRWKSHKSSQKLIPLETPTHQNADTDAECDGDSSDTDRGGGSRTGGQWLPALDASTLPPGHEGYDPDGGSTRTRNEQCDHSTPDLRSDEGDSNIRNRGEREDQGPGIQQPPETAREHTYSGVQDGGDAHDQVQSGKSKVKEKGWIDRTLRRAMAVIDLAKGPAEAFRSLETVVESISVSYTKYQGAFDVENKIEILCSRIIRLVELFGRPASDEEEKKRREGLINKLQDIEEHLRPLRKKSAPLGLADDVHDSKDVSGLVDDLQEAVGDYMMAEQMAIYDQGCMFMDAAEKSVLNNFRRAKGAEFRQDQRKGCLKGTRGVVLNAIELWARDPTKSPVYWLNGLAGTGKSTIAKTIAERLFADGLLGASFFCSRDYEDRRNLQLIFPTLTTQLARNYPEFRKILVPLIKSDPEVAYESLYNQMKRLIVQPLKQSGISTVIIIDALDECEDEGPASAILSVLGRLVSEIPKVKFLLTGRPEPRVYEGFRLPLLAKMTDTFVLHNVEQSQVGSDIRLFFTTGFSELAGRRSLDNWPGEEQLGSLCERAAGLFIYAAATVRFVDDNQRDPRSQLDLLLESQKIGAREGEALDTLYSSILQEAFSDNDPEDDARVRSILGAVILAVNPLSSSMIATLLGYDAEDVPHSLSLAKSLLVLQGDPGHPVLPFHKSFSDFITDSTRCTDKRFHISPADHHLQLLTGCLDLTNRTLAKNMCDLPDGVANLDVSDLSERVEEGIDPALQYASLWWHVHLADADTTPAHTPTITPTLRQFLEKKFLFWLEVLSVLGAVRNAVDALQVITDWLEESSTLDLASDCSRFVTGYFEVISASAPHIYHSALILVPQESMVRELYGSHARPFARVVHGGPASWGQHTAAITCPSRISTVAWSPCSKFIAITWHKAKIIDVLDSVTLQKLQVLNPQQTLWTPFQDPVLVFSPDSRILTGSVYMDGKLSFESWDLQTGDQTGMIIRSGRSYDIRVQFSIVYSANGKMIGVRDQRYNVILIFDIASGAHIHSYSTASSIVPTNDIWTHGESFRFTTVDTKTITIWEVGFTSDARPIVVETLPAPEHIDFWDQDLEVKFLPAPCRLAIKLEGPGIVMVWDFQDSEYLLHYKDAWFSRHMSFSSDGRLFACSTDGLDIYLWKESTTGYTLHGILGHESGFGRTLFSPNGEWIVAFHDFSMRLWRTKGFTTPPSSYLTQSPQHDERFLLDFSPDGVLAAIARKKDNKVTILDVRSGVPQLTIDAGMEVYGLRVNGNNTIAVADDRKVVTWDLPTGDRSPGAKATPEDSTRTIHLRGSILDKVFWVSISPDSSHIALADSDIFPAEENLHIHDAVTGEQIFTGAMSSGDHFFAPGGCNLLISRGGGESFSISGGGEVEQRNGVDIEAVGGYPWTSSRGYQITNDWWIVDRDGKRLLMLPSAWQFHKVELRVWKEHFLALLHSELPEPVILELNQ